MTSPAPASRSRSRSPAAKKRSRSPSPKKRSRSASRSRSPRKRSRSASPKKRSRSRSKSPARKSSRSKSPARKRSRSGSPRRRSRSGSPRKRSRSRSRSRGRGGRSRSRSRSRGRRGGSGQIEATKLYIGNLSFKTRDNDLRDQFERYGHISDVFIPLDGEGRSRGFAFVTYEDERDAEDAIHAMDDRDLMGRPIRVNKARAREGGFRGPPRGGYGGGGRGNESCRDYERGSCNRGSSCRFEHGGGGGRSRSRSRSRGGGRSRSRSRGRGRY